MLILREVSTALPIFRHLESAILNRPWAVISVLLMVTLAFGIAARGLRVDTSLEALLPSNDPELIFYQDFKQRFGSDEMVVIGAQASGLFEASALRAIERISLALRGVVLDEEREPTDATLRSDAAWSSERMKRARRGATKRRSLRNAEVPLIDRVTSLTEALEIVPTTLDDGTTSVSFGRLIREFPGSPEAVLELRSRALSRPLLANNLLGKASTNDPTEPLTTLILARIIDRPGDLGYRQLLVEQVASIVASEQGTDSRFEVLHLAGIPVLKSTLAPMSRQELRKLMPLELGVVLLALFLCFRTLRAVLLPLVALSLALIWTLGFLTLCGSHLSIATGVIVPLIMLIGVATSMYIFSEYYRRDRNTDEPTDAVRATLATVSLPSFLAALTTSVGFLSLATSPIPEIRDVGMFGAFGISSAWLITITLIPSVLILLPVGRRSAALSLREDRLTRLLLRTAGFTERFRWTVLVAALLIAVIAVGGIARIQATTDILGFLRPSHPLREAYAFIEREIGGIRPLSISIRAGTGDLLEPDILSKLERLQHWLLQQPEIDHGYSVIDYLKRVNQALHGGDSDQYRLPETRQEVSRYLGLAGAAMPLFLYPDRQNPEETFIRVRTPLLTSTEVADLTARFRSYFHEHGLGVAEPLEEGRRPLQSGQLVSQVTGVAVLNASMANSVVKGQIYSLSIALVAVWLTLIPLLRSVWVASLAMIPNLLPVLVMLGAMGYMGIRLDIGTAMIAAIALGVAIDDTIHFLARYRELRVAHGDERPALRATLEEVGRPMVLTSFSLAAGLPVLIFSAFTPHAYLGGFGALAILMALVSDVILLPAILFVFRPTVRGGASPVPDGP